ncbi:hypothetical protein CEXT_94001 [Caerostris extrusa]|uniref:Uncharacterized protein n=1 Tax=Caerostris extrusa TaxID=172846 RepID=A0AAV4QAQ3_CAEEX|nr:hypothetical protein CEXT_94001 [Caerostris extrusa]
MSVDSSVGQRTISPRFHKGFHRGTECKVLTLCRLSDSAKQPSTTGSGSSDSAKRPSTVQNCDACPCDSSCSQRPLSREESTYFYRAFCRPPRDPPLVFVDRYTLDKIRVGFISEQPGNIGRSKIDGSISEQ